MLVLPKLQGWCMQWRWPLLHHIRLVNLHGRRKYIRQRGRRREIDQTEQGMHLTMRPSCTCHIIAIVPSMMHSTDTVPFVQDNNVNVVMSAPLQGARRSIGRKPQLNRRCWARDVSIVCASRSVVCMSMFSLGVKFPRFMWLLFKLQGDLLAVPETLSHTYKSSWNRA